MAKSKAVFDRWTNFEQSSWSFQVFSKYDDQLGMMLTANSGAAGYCYSSMGKAGGQWTDNAATVLGTGDRFLSAFSDLKHWSKTYNEFQNWVRLNTVLACAANLESYIAGVVDTALQSDPGTLFGAPKALDGAKILKADLSGVDKKPHVIACTKGTWSSRFSAIEKIFSTLPVSANLAISKLESIRRIRNNVGHAFGRDIDDAQYHGLRELHPMEGISEEAAFSSMTTCRKFAKELDNSLLQNHIGDFEIIRFLHAHHQDIKSNKVGERVMDLKKAIGSRAQPRGKLYLRELIEYWDQL